MMRLPRVLGNRRPEPVLVVIAALLSASILVVYLQHRAIASLRRQAEMVVQGVSDSAATAVAAEIRRVLSGPVEVLNVVNQPQLNEGRLDLVAAAFAHGLDDYPQVVRFFVWDAPTDALAPDEVVFHDRIHAPPPPRLSEPAGDRRLADFHREPALGRVLYAKARAELRSQRNYAAVDAVVDGVPLFSVVRMFWANPRRDRPFTMLGFVVNLEDVRGRLFAELHKDRLAPLLAGRHELKLKILDDAGQAIFASGQPLARLSASASFPLQFYPNSIKIRMTPTPPPAVWQIVVGPSDDPPLAMFSATQAYWLSALSIALIVIALAFAVQGHARAKELARMQSDFISHVSHQLKTPLSLLSAVVETMGLERVRSPQKLARYLDTVREQTSRLTALVERILEFSRVETRRRRYEFEEIDLGQLVRETVDAFQQSLELEGFDVRVVAAGPSPILRADAVALEQALVNLLDNAVKYSGQHKRIRVHVGQSATEAVVSVADGGIGITPQDQPHIFERFFRGSGAALNRSGFGLGLAITAELVAAHGGRVVVESEPGHGSTFTIRLPRASTLTDWLSRSARLRRSVPRAS
jgi:signal transduction histidine kinase